MMVAARQLHRLAAEYLLYYKLEEAADKALTCILWAVILRLIGNKEDNMHKYHNMTTGGARKSSARQVAQWGYGV